MADLKIVGIMLTIFVGIVVGLAIFTGGITSPVAQMTQTFTVEKEKTTMPATSTPITFAYGQAVSNVVVTNATNVTQVIPATNYTITNYVVSNGALVAQLSSKASTYNGSAINISYTYEPYGYATDAGSRSMMSLIIVFAALAVAVFAMTPVLRSGVIEMFK